MAGMEWLLREKQEIFVVAFVYVFLNLSLDQNGLWMIYFFFAGM